MIKLGFAASAVVVLALFAGSSTAAPVTQSADSIAKAALDIGVVENTHGCHRVCAKGAVPRWGWVVRWHRHEGASCWPVLCRP